MSGVKHFAMAVKYGAGVPPADWRQRLAQIPGVTVTGSTSTRAQFVATPEAAAQVEQEFLQFRVEETTEREPAAG
jgi:hypothetical protein